MLDIFFIPKSDDITSLFFCLLIFCVFAFFCINEYRHQQKSRNLINDFKRKINEARCLNGEKQETDLMFDKIEQENTELKYVVLPFKNSLIEYIDPSENKKYCNSKAAEDFFNEHTIASYICEVRSLIPSLLTGLGVLGTFLGLLLALKDFDIGTLTDAINSSSSSDSNISNSTIINSLALLLSNSKVAFITSVWGIFFSITVTVIRSWVASSIFKSIKDFQHYIDKIFIPNISNDNILRKVGAKTNSVQDCIRELQSTIISTQMNLVDTLNKNSRESTEYLAKSITQYIADINKEALENAIQNMSGVFDKIFSKYSDNLEAASHHFEDATRNSTMIIKNEYLDWSKKFETYTSQTLSSIEKINVDIERWGAIAETLGSNGQTICQKLDEVIAGSSKSLAECTEMMSKFTSIQEAITKQVTVMDTENAGALARMEKFASTAEAMSSMLTQMKDIEEELKKGINNMNTIKPVLNYEFEKNIKDYTTNINAVTKLMTENWAKAYQDRTAHYEKVAEMSMNKLVKAFSIIAEMQGGNNK